MKKFLILAILVLLAIAGGVWWFVDKSKDPDSHIVSSSFEYKSENDVTKSLLFKNYTKKLAFNFNEPFELSVDEAAVSPDGSYFVALNHLSDYRGLSAAFTIGLAGSGAVNQMAYLTEGIARIVPESEVSTYIQQYVIEVLGHNGVFRSVDSKVTLQILDRQRSLEIIRKESQVKKETKAVSNLE